MNQDNAKIRESIDRVVRYFSEHPTDALCTDPPAVAIVEHGLRCRVSGPDGQGLVTDMPTAVGGGGAAPSPGWFMRAALASCDATVIAMRAAQVGVDLGELEVSVDSDSDDRGLFGMDGAEAAGPIRTRVKVRIAAPGVSAARLREIVEWAESNSPVGDAIRRAVPMTTTVDFG